MESMVNDGLVRHLGVSNFSLKQVEELLGYARIKPVANQIELHPFLAQRKMVGVCARKVWPTSKSDVLALPQSLRCMKTCIYGVKHDKFTLTGGATTTERQTGKHTISNVKNMYDVACMLREQSRPPCFPAALYALFASSVCNQKLTVLACEHDTYN